MAEASIVVVSMPPCSDEELKELATAIEQLLVERNIEHEVTPINDEDYVHSIGKEVFYYGLKRTAR